MDTTDATVAVFKNLQGAEFAVKKLASGGFPMNTLSVVGKGYHTDEKVVGFFNPATGSGTASAPRLPRRHQSPKGPADSPRATVLRERRQEEIEGKACAMPLFGSRYPRRAFENAICPTLYPDDTCVVFDAHRARETPAKVCEIASRS